MELKVTKDKVLTAAASCSDAKRILQTLFPEAFGLGGGAIDKGVFFVKSKQAPAYPGSERFTAVTFPAFLRAYENHYKYTFGKTKVVVLSHSNDRGPNGWSYDSWEEFHKAWQVCLD